MLTYEQSAQLPTGCLKAGFCGRERERARERERERERREGGREEKEKEKEKNKDNSEGRTGLNCGEKTPVKRCGWCFVELWCDSGVGTWRTPMLVGIEEDVGSLWARNEHIWLVQSLLVLDMQWYDPVANETVQTVRGQHPAARVFGSLSAQWEVCGWHEHVGCILFAFRCKTHVWGAAARCGVEKCCQTSFTPSPLLPSLPLLRQLPSPPKMITKNIEHVVHATAVIATFDFSSRSRCP